MKIGSTRWVAIIVGSFIGAFVSYGIIVQVFGLSLWWILAPSVPLGLILGWNLDRIIGRFTDN